MNHVNMLTLKYKALVFQGGQRYTASNQKFVFFVGFDWDLSISSYLNGGPNFGRSDNFYFKIDLD